jgi:single-strand DNA-binding protein
MNIVIISGHVGKEPEMRYLPDGSPVINFSVATNEKWKNKSGDKQTRTEWHPCVSWNKQAEIVGKYVHKGDHIDIEGKLRTRKWQDKDGNSRYTTEVVVKTIEFHGTNKAILTQTDQNSAIRDEETPPEYEESLPM